MRRRITSNSGAPRCGFPAGSGSPRATSSVHSTSSLSGRLNCRLKCPAARHASSDRMSEPAIARITIAPATRVVRYSYRRASMSEVPSTRSWSSSAVRCAAVSGAPFIASSTRRPLASTSSHGRFPLSTGSTELTPAAPPSSSTLVGTIANSAR